MSLWGKVAVVIALLLIVGGVSIPILPSLMVSPPRIENVEAVGVSIVDGSSALEVTATIVNTAGVDVFLESGSLNVFYGGEPIGRMLVSSVPLPSGRPVTIIGYLLLGNEEVLGRALSEIVKKGSIKLTYSGDFDVVPLTLPVRFRGIGVEGSAEFTLGAKAVSLFSIERISTTESYQLIVQLVFQNPLSMSIKVDSITGKILYLNTPVGVVNYEEPINLAPGQATVVNVTTTPYNVEMLSLALKKLIEEKSLELVWQGAVEFDFLGVKPVVEFELPIAVGFDFEFRTVVSGVAMIRGEDQVELTAGVRMSLSRNLDVEFTLNKLSFKAYARGFEVGSGFLKEPVKFGRSEYTNITVVIAPNKANLGESLKVFFEGNETIELRDAVLELEVFKRLIGVRLDVPLKVELSPNSLNITVKARFNSLKVDIEKRLLDVGFAAFINIENVEGLDVYLKSPTITLVEESGIELRYTLGDIRIKESGSWVPVELVLSLDDPTTQKLAERFFGQGYLVFDLKHIESDGELLGTKVHVSADIEARVEAYPVTIFSILVESGEIRSLGGGRFLLRANVTTKATNYNVEELYLRTIKASIYDEEGSVLLARNVTLVINKLVPPGNITFTSLVEVEVEREGVEWFASRMFAGTNITVTVRHIEVDITVQDWEISVPLRDTKSVVRLTSAIAISVFRVDVLAPGNVMDAELEIMLGGINVPAVIDELTFEMEDLDGNLVGRGRLLRFMSSPKPGVVKGLFEMVFEPGMIEKVIKGIVLNGTFSGYGRNVHYVGRVDNIPINTTLLKTMLLSIHADFDIKTNIEITYFTVKDPGTLVEANVKISVKLPDNIHIPEITVVRGEFKVYDPVGRKLLGYGEFMPSKGSRITGGQGVVEGTSSVTFTEEGIQWFAERLLGVGTVKVLAKDIVISGKLLSTPTSLWAKPSVVSYKSSPLNIRLVNVRLTKLTIIPPSASAKADVEFRNPFDFPIKLVSSGGPSLVFDVLDADSQAYIGNGEYRGSIYISSGGSTIIRGVKVDVPPAGATYLYFNRRSGNKISFSAYAKGWGIAMIYKVRVKFRFKTGRVHVVYTL